MKRPQPQSPFQLESPDPRILLSGDPTERTIMAIVPDEVVPLYQGPEMPPFVETLNPAGDPSQDPAYQQSAQYDQLFSPSAGILTFPAERWRNIRILLKSDYKDWPKVETPFSLD